MELRLYPGFVSVAIRKKHAGGLALWVLARALDTTGTGAVKESDLRQAALEVWEPGKWYRCKQEAIGLGLLTPWKDGRLGLTGLHKVCIKLKVDDPGYNPVIVKISAIKTAATFKAACFAAFHAAGRGRNKANPISRATLTELTESDERVGLGRKTQSVYEARNNARRDGQTKANANFALTGIPAKHLAAARELVHPACYLWGGEVVRPLPNSYSSTLKLASGSRLRKVRRKLGSTLVHRCGAGKVNRVFYDNAQEADKALRSPEAPAAALVFKKRSYKGLGVYQITT